jgi:hypothetical protein
MYVVLIGWIQKSMSIDCCISSPVTYPLPEDVDDKGPANPDAVEVIILLTPFPATPQGQDAASRKEEGGLTAVAPMLLVLLLLLLLLLVVVVVVFLLLFIHNMLVLFERIETGPDAE